jgi:hypothetical protein
MIHKLVFILAVAALPPSILRAQTYEVAPTFAFQKMGSVLLGSTSGTDAKDDDSRFKNGAGAGLRLTWNTRGYYGMELAYSYNRLLFETKVRPEGASEIVRSDRIKMQQLSYNFLCYFMPAGERWRPFVTGGLQAYRYGAPRIPEWPGGGSTNIGGNYGGGIKLKLMSHVLVRLDVRQFIGGKPYKQLTFVQPSSVSQSSSSGGALHQLEGSVGIGFTF